MSMSTHIVGYKKADAKWEKMKAIWIACRDSDVEIPGEVEKFFRYDDPSDKPGMEIDIKEYIEPYRSDGSEGFEIEIGKLPKDIQFIRFFNAW